MAMDRREFVKLCTTAGAAAVLGMYPGDATGTKRDRTYLLTEPVFNSRYEPLGTADDIARSLYPLSLQELVDKGIVTSGIKDLALPLGTRYGRKDVNFYRGMRDMWNAKQGIRGSRALQERRDHFLNEMRQPTKSSLREYRRNEIAKGIEAIGELDRNTKYDEETERLVRNMAEMISPNVLIGYNIHEITPPGYNERQINPVFKAYFLDRLFKEAGKEFVEGYPARYDSYMSHGPFQMTNFAMPSAFGMNRYVSAGNRVPRYVQHLDGIQQHVNAASMFAFSNVVMLGNHLRRHNLLRKFNDGFERMGEREKQILAAGLTACMHHQPAMTKERVGWYVDRRRPGNDMFYALRNSLTGQLQKYYDSAAEAYLIMKTFHELDENHGKT
jgi:hypothetical protein